MRLTQNEKRKTENANPKQKSSQILGILLISAFSILFFRSVFAEEITILYTGETHAMLYPCSCPKEPDGGVARRATLLKQLRKSYPKALLLDSGGFFAGGLHDEYTQNTQLDTQRTMVNLKAMELMKYDALAIGDDEFNFGDKFLQDSISKTGLNFLSCNVKAQNILPSVVKEVSGVKIGIIGVTGLAAMEKAGNLKFIDPKTAVAAQVAELRKAGVNIIVLLSHLGENEDLNLLNQVKGIDILIVGHSRIKEEPFSKIENTLLLRPSWQGRRLGKLTFNVKDNKVTDAKVEELRLSDKIADDPDILAILPRCFSDAGCKKEGLVGSCQNPGTLDARCLFSEANKVNLTVISSRSCRTCNPDFVVNFLKRQFPGLASNVVYYPESKEAQKLVKDFVISGLPAYLFSKEVEKDKGFENLKANAELKGNFYVLKPQFSGISYFLERKKIPGRFDVFISPYDKDATGILAAVKEYNPTIHFLASEQDGKFDAAKGNLEVEEDLRAVCVQKYYPQNFYNYITCRSENINSSWWEDCAGGLDTNKIRTCARSEEGKTLLKENIATNRELQIMLGPAYLVDNQEIFGSKGVPAKDELKKIMKR